MHITIPAGSKVVVNGEVGTVTLEAGEYRPPTSERLVIYGDSFADDTALGSTARARRLVDRALNHDPDDEDR